MHTHIHTHAYTCALKVISRNQVCSWRRLGLKLVNRMVLHKEKIKPQILSNLRTCEILVSSVGRYLGTSSL